MKIYAALEKALRKEPNFVSDSGELKKWVVLDRAQNYDVELISLLLDDSELKEFFFLKIKDSFVFNQSLFVQFLEQKNYLNNSYTAYKNKVGLTIDGKYLKQRNEVSLVWPFKDCVLEGGQSREEDKREEIFFNEILAQDEITQLLEPKVLTNAKCYSVNGEEDFDKFNRNEQGTITDNLIIKGNNLLALHSLKKEFGGKVKLIYIDPPYNTGNDGFKYNDNFNHSSWLTFMKNRTECARDLLAEDGIIAVSIDHSEAFHLKIVLDEIFGRNNFLSSITVQNNPKGRVMDKNFSTSNEYLFFYSKNNLKQELAIRKTDMEVRNDYPLSDYDGFYRELELRNTHREFGKHNRPNLFYSIFVNPETGLVSLTKSEEFSISVLPLWEDDYEGCWTWNQTKAQLQIDLLTSRRIKDKWKIYRKAYSTDSKGENVSKKLKTIWLHKDFHTEKGQKTIDLIIGKDKFKAPKPVGYIKTIIDLVTSTYSNDIVLDFFGGSGTTAQAVYDLNLDDGGNRQFILCEQMDYINSITIDRVSKVMSKNNSNSLIYLELKKYNQNFIDKIIAATDSDMVLKIWEEMKAKSFLNYNVDIQKQEAHLSEFKELSLNEQKQHLIEILDKNQLYVNLSSLKDKDFAVTEEEKAITKDFYQLKN